MTPYLLIYTELITKKIIITKRNCIGFMEINKKESKIYIHLCLVKNCMQV